MNPYVISAGVGRVTAAVNDVTLAPRLWQRDGSKRGVIFAHAASLSSSAYWSTTSPNQALAAYLGGTFPCVGIDMGDSWGNATALARIGAARTYLQSVMGAAAGKVYLLAESMGGIAAARYAAAHPTEIAAIAGIIPGFNMQQLRVSNALGLRASIDTAWGVVYPAALPAGANPSDAPHALDGIPYRAWTTSNDTVFPQSDATAFLAAIGGTQVNLGALGHFDGIVSVVPPVDVESFFLTYP